MSYDLALSPIFYFCPCGFLTRTPASLSADSRDTHLTSLYPLPRATLHNISSVSPSLLSHSWNSFTKHQYFSTTLLCVNILPLWPISHMEMPSKQKCSIEGSGFIYGRAGGSHPSSLSTVARRKFAHSATGTTTAGLWRKLVWLVFMWYRNTKKIIMASNEERGQLRTVGSKLPF